MKTATKTGLTRMLCGSVGLAAVVCVAGCGDKAQTATARKADAAPADGGGAGATAAYTAPGWKAGDATSWETHLKKRAEGQNEYTRTQRN
jgi:hypothetical protein